MNAKKTIQINATLPKAILIGLVLGIIAVFGIEHFGKFTYFADTSGIPETDGQGRILLSIPVKGTTPVISIEFSSPFDSQLKISGSGWNVKDVHFSNSGKFHEYSNTFQYYLKATFLDFKYIIYIGLAFAISIFLFENYKIKLTS